MTDPSETIETVTAKQKAILGGAWRNAVSTFTGVLIAEGAIQGVTSWLALKTAFLHTCLIAVPAVIFSEARYWKQWADTSAPPGGTIQ